MKLNYEFRMSDINDLRRRHAKRISLLEERLKVVDYTERICVSDYIDRDIIVNNLLPMSPWTMHLTKAFKREKTQQVLKQIKSHINKGTHALIMSQLKRLGVPAYLATALYVTNYKYINHEMKQALKIMTR